MSRKKRKAKKHESLFSRRSLPGSSPGTLIIDPDAPKPVLRLMAFSPDRIIEKDIEDPLAARPFVGQWPVTWINVTGLGDLSVITKLGEIFNLHRLALEDVINVHQRPKVEQYRDYCYIVVRIVKDSEKYASEQVSIFLGKDFVVSLQEQAGEYFNPVLDRIRAGTGRMRTAGPDHLAYALIDAIIDCYFPVLERYGEQVEALEDAIVAQPDNTLMNRIQELRHGLMTLRRVAWPLREAMTILYRDPIPLIDEEERFYLRDCYDHLVQIIDLLENYRDVTSGLMEVYLTSLSNRTNEIMKVLTIITAIFVPMTLIAGIYGMNFNTEASPWNMPELEWGWGYPFALGLMALVAIILMLYFRKKGWLGKKD
jgi:magnesium transporter